MPMSMVDYLCEMHALWLARGKPMGDFNAWKAGIEATKQQILVSQFQSSRFKTLAYVKIIGEN